LSEKHWEKYRKYYIGVGISLGVISLVVVVYRFLIKEWKK
jgi:hypothetical protein